MYAVYVRPAIVLFGVATARPCDLHGSLDYTRGVWRAAAAPPTAPEGVPNATDPATLYTWGNSNASCAAKASRWAWAPTTCAVDGFERDALLETLRNKHVLFVGDSITEKNFESLRLLLGSPVAVPHIFYDADFYGLHFKGTGDHDLPSKCWERHVGIPPERWVTATASWLCCKRNCQAQRCCQTLR